MTGDIYAFQSRLEYIFSYICRRLFASSLALEMLNIIVSLAHSF